MHSSITPSPSEGTIPKFHFRSTRPLLRHCTSGSTAYVASISIDANSSIAAACCCFSTASRFSTLIFSACLFSCSTLTICLTFSQRIREATFASSACFAGGMSVASTAEPSSAVVSPFSQLTAPSIKCHLRSFAHFCVLDCAPILSSSFCASPYAFRASAIRSANVGSLWTSVLPCFTLCTSRLT